MVLGLVLDLYGIPDYGHYAETPSKGAFKRCVRISPKSRNIALNAGRTLDGANLVELKTCRLRCEPYGALISELFRVTLLHSKFSLTCNTLKRAHRALCTNTTISPPV